MRLRPMFLLPFVLVLSLVALAGCGDGEEAATTTAAGAETTTEAAPDTETTTTDSETTTTAAGATTTAPDATDLPPLDQECSSPAGYRLSYPAGWVTNEEQANQLPPCSLFDPESVELGETLHVPETIAIRVGVEEVAFDETVDSRFEEELDREDLRVGGRTAVRLETRSTGEGLLDRGIESTSYRIDMGDGRTFIATTYDVGELDYETKQEILDRIMETLRFVESGSRAY
jgi:hypothetical protein